MKNILIWIVILIIGASGLTYYLQRQGHFKQATTAKEKPIPIPESKPEPAISYPIPKEENTEATTNDETPPEEAVAPEPPLPKLSDSDNSLLRDLGGLIDLKSYRTLFILKEVIQRFVVTVNNLTTDNLPRKYLLTRPVKGSFAVIKNDQGKITLDPKNYDRYTLFIRMLEKIDVNKLMRVYIHYYPLFQEAYESLGYPGKYFNDRLIQVIDNLLDAPEINGVIKLKQPKVFYQFADPELESLSAGQKIMLRMGPDNAERVKAFLRALRLELIR